MCDSIGWKSPRDRYRNDSQFHLLVDTLLHQITSARFTPSELREAAILASIIYAETQPVRIPTELLNWLDEVG